MTPRRAAALLVLLAATVAALVGGVAPAGAQAQLPVDTAAASRAAWSAPAARRGATPAGAQIAATQGARVVLDAAALAPVLDRAPGPRTAGRGTVVSVPAPDGSFERFAVTDVPVLAPALAARHPEIRTLTGTGVDDRSARIRLDLTPQGFHASVRSARTGAWYVDPLTRGDARTHLSYRRRDAVADPARRVRDAGEHVVPQRLRARRAGRATARRGNGQPVVLRTYRLALISDPTYSAYSGGTPALVLAAKATLMNRVNQLYEDDFAITMQLIAGSEALDLGTAAAMTGANGPCGTSPCYTPEQATGCSSDTLDRNVVVAGLLAGASDFDIGHIVLGLAGGGIAGLGVVGDPGKAAGCTGLPTPVGDFFAVDYVAHEMGHEFGGNHTFDGTQGNCSGANRNGPTAVEPGSGSTVMAYAGICDGDDVQQHSDPYFSQRSTAEITTEADAAPGQASEIQTVSLRGFDAGESFRLRYRGQTSAALTNGTTYNATGLVAALRSIGITASIFSWDGATAAVVGPEGFEVDVTAPARTDLDAIELLPGAGVSGFVGETVRGGATTNGGAAAATAGTAPLVDAGPDRTIPVRTPFRLTGSGRDPNGDALVYLWEQDDPGDAVSPLGTGLADQIKLDGPLFRVFGTAATTSDADADGDGTADELQSPAPGQNAATGDPSRTFPDQAQIAALNTNAATGACAGTDTAGSPADRDCLSEFLPTAAYVPAALRFRLTARDRATGAGGSGADDVALTLAKQAGPFRVSSQGAGTAPLAGGTPLRVTWDVAGTTASGVDTAAVRLSLSVDGGRTFPVELAASTPNDGAQDVTVAPVTASRARVRVEAVGNVFFDDSDADVEVRSALAVRTDAPAGGVRVEYSDAPAPVAVTADSAQPAQLSASAAGLPEGLALTPQAPTGTGRSFTVTGATTAAPGTYDALVTVTEGGGATGVVPVRFLVEPERASAALTGPATADTGGAATAPLRLRGAVTAAVGGDATPGELDRASLSFLEDGRVLCADVPVAADGTAACDVALPAGRHAIALGVGGRYLGSGSGAVEVAATTPGAGPDDGQAPTTPATAPEVPATTQTTTVPAPGAPPAPAPAPGLTPTTATTVPVPVPVPARAAPRVRIAFGSFRLRGRSARVTIACPANAAARCAGTVTFRRSSRRLAARSYSVAPGRRVTVRVTIPAAVRRIVRRTGRSLIRVEATNRASGRTTSRAVRSARLRRAR